MSWKFGQIRPWTAELAALERLKKSHRLYNGRNVVTTLAPSSLIETSSPLQETRTCIKAWMSLNLNQIKPLTMELPALEHLKKSMYNVVNTLALSFLIGSSSFLQVMRTTIKSRISSKFGQIRLDAELCAP